MAALASHNPFASLAQSLPAPQGAPGCRVARSAWLGAAKAKGAPTLPALLAVAALPPHTPPRLPVHHLPLPLACDSDSSAPTPDVCAAKLTTATPPLRCARPPSSVARTDGGFPHSLVAVQMAARLETRQTARSFPLGQPLSWRCPNTTLRPYHGQKRARPHRERDMPIPSTPRAHFVVVEANLTFACLDAFFHRPSFASHLHVRLQGRVGWRKHCIGRHVIPIREAAPKQQRAAPGSIGWRVQRHLLPLVHALAFTARTSAPAPPVLLG